MKFKVGDKIKIRKLTTQEVKQYNPENYYENNCKKYYNRYE